MTGVGTSSKDGCEVSSKCLYCPLTECRYDNPVPFQAWKRTLERTKKGELVLKLWEKGFSSMQIADKLKMSPRTVMKLAQEARDRLATNSITIH